MSCQYWYCSVSFVGRRDEIGEESWADERDRVVLWMLFVFDYQLQQRLPTPRHATPLNRPRYAANWWRGIIFRDVAFVSNSPTKGIKVRDIPYWQVRKFLTPHFLYPQGIIQIRLCISYLTCSVVGVSTFDSPHSSLSPTPPINVHAACRCRLDDCIEIETELK